MGLTWQDGPALGHRPSPLPPGGDEENGDLLVANAKRQCGKLFAGHVCPLRTTGVNFFSWYRSCGLPLQNVSIASPRVRALWYEPDTVALHECRSDGRFY